MIVRIGALFEKGNMGLGWAALWRLTLILLPLNLLAKLAAQEASMNPAGAVAMLLALPVGGNVYLVPIAIPVMLFTWNWIGKYVMRKKLAVRTDRFVGWSLYWRVALLQLAGIFALTLVFLPLTFLAQQSDDRVRMVIMAVAGLVLFPALIYWSLNVVGFVLRRVAASVPLSDKAIAESVELGAVRVRGYQSLFDRSRYGMNWMFAAAYPAAGLVSTLTYPLVDAMFGRGFAFDMFEMLHVLLLTWAISGLGLALFLHRFRSAWQVVGAFVVLLTLMRPVDSFLMGFTPGAPDTALLDPQGLILRASFALLFASGLLAGIRLIGPGIVGFGLGTGLATLIQLQLVVPAVIAQFQDIPVSDIQSPLRLASDFVSALLEAVINGVAFWWACDWHLGRHGLRLSQQGVIQSDR